jgi:kynurenine formamidase
MRTVWSKRWPSVEAMQSGDEQGFAHYSGWSQEVQSHRYDDHRIAASGHEIADNDLCIATSKDDYSLETYILKQHRYQIEFPTTLDPMPKANALVIATVPKPKVEYDFPARVFAIPPQRALPD